MLTYQTCKKGMLVYIGRERGEKTKAIVEKPNPKSCKVKILESRGTGRGSEAGSIWNVAYDFMTPGSFSTPTVENVTPKLVSKALIYNPFDDRNGYFELMLDCYSGLSPENLHQDGEASRSHVIAQSAKLNRRLKYLTKRDYLESERNRRLKETAEPTNVFSTFAPRSTI